MSELKDSGTRREFSTGAVRDVADGKGRCDLLPLAQVSATLDSVPIALLYQFMKTGAWVHLRSTILNFCKERGWDLPTAMLEVSIHYEDGARKYAERNWEIGIPLHCFIDSAVRHYLKWRRGDTDEPHDRAVLWNLLGAWWTLDNHPELNDLPCARKGGAVK